MKTSRLVIGIISIVLFVLVTFQSCVAGISNELAENGEAGGSAGFLLALCLLIAGIVGICVRNSDGKAPYVSGGFYLFGALIALENMGSYGDLIVWSVLSIIFGLAFIIPTFVHNRKMKKKQ